ncbi:MAG: AI-2E family transporter [Anaerolineae bacterium]|nr:AI-2E family transporter [Anaerolineae bacterium]
MTMTQFARRTLAVVLITVSVIGGLLLIVSTFPILLLIFTSVLIAVGLRGLTDALSTRTPIPSNIAFVIVSIAVLIGIVILIVLIVPSLSFQMDELLASLNSALDQLRVHLSDTKWGQHLLDQLSSASISLPSGSDIFGRVTGIFSNALGVFTNVIFIVFVGLYFAITPHIYVDGALALVPQGYRPRAREILDTMYRMLKQWLLTRAVSMVAIGIMTALGLAALGMPFLIALTIFAGIMAFIPAIGPILALIPAVLVAFTQSMQQVLLVILLYLIVQSIDNYLLTPIVEHRAISLPAALVFISQLLLGVLVGFIGVVVAAPLTVVLMVAIKMIYVEDVLHNHASQSE